MQAHNPALKLPSRSAFRGLLLALVWAVCFSSHRNALIAQGPENVLVVVNAESQDSLAIANKHIDLRDIPACNVVYLRGITTLKNHDEQSTSSKAFKREILDPLLKAMKDRGIENQIDCIAYSAGFPTRVNIQTLMKTYLKQTGKKYNIQLHAPWASITSLTYFHRNAFSRRPNFLELDANHYANPRYMKMLTNPFTGKEAANFDAAMQSMKVADYDQAIEKLIPLGSVHRQQVPVLYNLARCFALTRERKKSLTLLQQMKNLGLSSKSLLESDKAFANIRSLPDFKDITNQMEDLPDRVAPTRSFSSQSYWGKNGWPSGNDDQGERYLLSSVLAVTGKNQSSLADSLTRLESSADADGTAPNGNVYFAAHKDARSQARKSQFRFAAAELKSLGRTASIGSEIYPMNDKRVIGATLGSAVATWSKSKSKFLPGAICDNLTSYGAVWEKEWQTQINEWLDAGAAGASGTVYEPSAIAPKFPSARWHAHYARGATLAESYYQSVSGPFQLLLVGDPLCCPFGKFPKFGIKGLEEGASVTKDFVLQLDQAATSPPIKRYEIYYDGVLLGKLSDSDQIAVATDAMNDGYHEMRVVGVGDSVVENRTSHTVGFVVNRNDHSLDLSTPNPRIRVGSSMMVQADSSLGKRIQIRQNSRTIATVQSGKQARITAAQIGLGKSKIQAVVVLENGTSMRSKPLTVEVLQ